MGVLVVVAAALAAGFAVLCVRAARLRPDDVSAGAQGPEHALDAQAIAEHVSGALQCATVSGDDMSAQDYAPFVQLQRYLRETYPLVHEKLELEIVDGYALLYRWKGAGDGALPVLFVAHQDVVPAGDEGAWTHPPFSGAIEDGYVWGRGAIDMKGQLVCILEAAEALLREGFVPRRDIYFAFGHNEEASHETGAIETSELLRRRGVRFAWIVDEGGSVMHGDEFGVGRDIAFIGLSEKGYADLTLRAHSAGGHASQPPEHTAVGELAIAIARLEKRPMRARIEGIFAQTLRTLAPHMGFAERLMVANSGVFAPLLIRRYAKSPRMNALMRTTMAPTMLSGSPAPNVLAQTATANVNCRLTPRDTLEGLVAHAQAAVGAWATVELAKGNPAAPVTPMDGRYDSVAAALREVMPHCVMAPHIMVGATDSRFYADLTDAILRVMPFASYADDGHTMHAANERVAVSSLEGGVRFFMRLMEAPDA